MPMTVLIAQSVNPPREAISGLSGKFERFMFAHPVFVGIFKDVHRRQKLTTDFFQTF